MHLLIYCIELECQIWPIKSVKMLSYQHELAIDKQSLGVGRISVTNSDVPISSEAKWGRCTATPFGGNRIFKRHGLTEDSHVLIHAYPLNIAGRVGRGCSESFCK